jgi:hypothetical protein
LIKALSADHIALGLLFMSMVFAPIAAALGVALRGLEKRGALRLAMPGWRLACALAVWIAWTAQALYWLGRERAQHEYRARLDPYLDWWTGWNVLEWTLDAQLDLALPLLVNGIVAAALCWLLVRRASEPA